MSKKTVPDLKELFKQAAEIAQQVPQNMQEAAFNRALDLLTNNSSARAATGQSVDSPKGIKKDSIPLKGKTENGGSVVDQLLTDIDSTQHPGLISNLKVLDRALMVLQIALTDHKVDGLTPSEISRILTDKFRIGTTYAAVNMAISKETNLVNRVPDGSGYRYRIMGPGQEYLSKLGQDENKTRSTSKKRPAFRKRREKDKTIVQASAGQAKKGRGPRQGSLPSKTGVKAALLELLSSGFFSEGQTGPDVQIYLEKKRGLSFGTDQLRLAMLRLVREQKLERDDNPEGKYEYRQPSK